MSLHHTTDSKGCKNQENLCATVVCRLPEPTPPRVGKGLALLLTSTGELCISAFFLNASVELIWNWLASLKFIRKGAKGSAVSEGQCCFRKKRHPCYPSLNETRDLSGWYVSFLNEVPHNSWKYCIKKNPEQPKNKKHWDSGFWDWKPFSFFQNDSVPFSMSASNEALL